MTLTPDLNDPTQQTAKILQENDYYAFGYGIQSMQGIVASPKNEYLYNHKELQEETGLYDYGARFYDPVIGRWGSVDPLVEKYLNISPYQYVANNPILNIDAKGDSIIVTSSSDNNIKIRITGKLINDSQNSYSSEQMTSFANRISGTIKQYYQGASSDDFQVSVITDITAASSENPLKDGDHAFRITNAGEIPDYNSPGTGLPDMEAVGMAPPTQNVVYLSTDLLNEKPAEKGQFAGTGISSTGQPTLERTAAHEIGHSAGLTFGNDYHPARGTMPGNLMNQSSSGGGTKVTKGEILQIKKNYEEGKLNKGQQKF